MSGSGVKLSADWSRFLGHLDPKNLRARLARGAALAGARVGRDFERDARRRIRARLYAPNSPVTVILKGSSAPLVDKGDLFQAITYAQPDPYTLHLGVMRAAVGDKGINVALILHEGATIDVKRHPQVRRKVWAMVREGLGDARLKALGKASRTAVTNAAGQLGIKPKATPQRRAMFAHLFATGKIARPASGGGGKDLWIIPARPFLREPIESPEFSRSVVTHYGQAVRAAFGGP